MIRAFAAGDKRAILNARLKVHEKCLFCKCNRILTARNDITGGKFKVGNKQING